MAKTAAFSINYSAIFVFMIALTPLLFLGRGLLVFSKTVKIELKPAASQPQVQGAQTTVCVPGDVPVSTTGYIPTQVSFPNQTTLVKIQGIGSKLGDKERETPFSYMHPNSSLIKQLEGNVGLYGNDGGNVFEVIRTLHRGDTVILSNAEVTATYTVTDIDLPYAPSINHFAPSKEPTLTLVAYKTLLIQHKYIVRAKLVNIQRNCNETH